MSKKSPEEIKIDEFNKKTKISCLARTLFDNSLSFFIQIKFGMQIDEVIRLTREELVLLKETFFEELSTININELMEEFSAKVYEGNPDPIVNRHFGIEMRFQIRGLKKKYENKDD